MSRSESTQGLQSLMSEYADDSDQDDADTSGQTAPGEEETDTRMTKDSQDKSDVGLVMKSVTPPDEGDRTESGHTESAGHVDSKEGIDTNIGIKAEPVDIDIKPNVKVESLSTTDNAPTAVAQAKSMLVENIKSEGGSAGESTPSPSSMLPGGISSMRPITTTPSAPTQVTTSSPAAVKPKSSAVPADMIDDSDMWDPNLTSDAAAEAAAAVNTMMSPDSEMGDVARQEEVDIADEATTAADASVSQDTAGAGGDSDYRKQRQGGAKRTALVSYVSEGVDDDDDEEDEDDVDDASGVSRKKRRRTSSKSEDAAAAAGGEGGVKQENEEDDDDVKPVTGHMISAKWGDVDPASFSKRVRHLSAADVTLPPEVEGRCSRKLQEKMTQMLRKQEEKGANFNELIENRKDFRNPSIYEKLILLCKIDEIGTNYPPDVYNPHCWKKDEFYDELAKQQKVDMDRREKERKERTKVEFVSGMKKPPPTSSAAAAGTSDSASTAADGSVAAKPGRKTKWDQQSAPSVPLLPPPSGTSQLRAVASMGNLQSAVKPLP